MRIVITWAVGFVVTAVALRGATAQPPSPNPDSQYRLGPDSLPQEGVPKGEIKGPFTLPCQVFPRPHYGRRGYDYWQQLEDGRLVVGGRRDVDPEREQTAE